MEADDHWTDRNLGTIGKVSTRLSWQCVNYALLILSISGEIFLLKAQEHKPPLSVIISII